MIQTKPGRAISDHGSLTGLGDDDHPQYLLANGTRALSANWNAGAFRITAQEFAGWGIVPVGGVVAWLKSFAGTPALPDGWVECNGQVLADAASVYNGQTVPNLNGSGGTRRFLRGSTASGATGGSTTHTHSYSGCHTSYGPSATVSVGIGPPWTTVAHQCHSHVVPVSGTTGNTSTLPNYYEVVWVWRVK